MPKTEIIKKCQKCESDILIGQRYCMECGQEQEVPVRTKEEILEMREQVREIMKKGEIELPVIMLCIVANMTLDWCLGNSEKEKVLKLLELKKGE